MGKILSKRGSADPQREIDSLIRRDSGGGGENKLDTKLESEEIRG
jgi:hypothetical protein